MVEIFPLYKKCSSLFGYYHVAEKGIALDLCSKLKVDINLELTQGS